MASKAAMDAIAAKLTSVWASVNPGAAAPILPNTLVVEPDPKTAFLSLTFPVAMEEMKSTGAPGANVFRESGAFRVVIAVPAGDDLSPSLAHLDAIRAAFRAQVFAGVTTFEASPTAIGAAEDGETHFFLSTAIAYKFDVFG